MNKNQQIEPSEQAKGFAVLLVMGVILFLIIRSCTSSDSTDYDVPSDHSLKVKAQVYSQHCVEQKLKSPSSAEFPYDVANVESLGNNKYAVNSYVDSQNGFGAMIRTNYRCEVTLLGGDDYSCDSVVLFE